MNRRFTYKWKWPRSRGFDGLALNCHMWTQPDGDVEFRFFSTLRGHAIPGEIIRDGDDAFTFLSRGFEPGEWQFEKLTIEDVRRGVVWIENGDIIGQTIHDTDDLQEWYRKQFGKEAGLFYPEVLNE